MSMLVHSGESAGCLSIPSSFLHSTCHNNNFASFGFEKRRCNLGSIGKYQITFALAPFILSISSLFCLYLEALHFKHFFKSLCTPRNNIQSFGQTRILFASIIKGHNIFFALYVESGISLFSRRISFKSSSNDVKLLSLHPFFAFKLYNLKKQ
jgi:hypothetical protein